MKSKYILRFLFALLLTFSAVPAIATERAGTIERIKGTAERSQGTETVQLSDRKAVFVGDEISTGPESRLLIRFLDQSSLTLGADAKVVIDSVIYDTAGLKDTADGQVINFVQGVFQFVSGKIAQNDPRSFALNTSVATIGIRGTEFVGGELTVGMPPGTSHIGFQIRDGAIEVTNTLGSVTLDEPGEGTFIPVDGSAAPTPVRQWTPEEAAEADELLAF